MRYYTYGTQLVKRTDGRVRTGERGPREGERRNKQTEQDQTKISLEWIGSWKSMVTPESTPGTYTDNLSITGVMCLSLLARDIPRSRLVSSVSVNTSIGIV